MLIPVTLETPKNQFVVQNERAVLPVFCTVDSEKNLGVSLLDSIRPEGRCRIFFSKNVRKHIEEVEDRHLETVFPSLHRFFKFLKHDRAINDLWCMYFDNPQGYFKLNNQFWEPLNRLRLAW